MEAPRLRVVGIDARTEDPEGLFWTKAGENHIADPDIPDSALRVLLAITSMADSFGKCSASIPEIAKRCGKSAPAVERSVARLASAGLIERIGRTKAQGLALCFKFRQGSKKGPRLADPGEPIAITSDGKRPPSLPSPVMANAITSDGNCHHLRGSLPSLPMAILKETEIKKNSDTATSPPSAGERHAATSAGRQNPPVPSASPPPTPGDIRFNESMTTADDMGLALVAIDNLVRWGLPERVCKASFDRLASEYPMGFRLMLIGWKRDGIGGLTSDDKNDRPVRAVEVHTGRSEEPIP